ncbi:MAG: tetratricopeptide repeat protein [Bacteroidales bacterium]|nr:tetratricopeptide repeat protein [Bacteroidales bacterium]
MNIYSRYKLHFKSLVIILLIMISGHSVILAQKAEPYVRELTDFERAKDLFGKEKYAMALGLFDTYLRDAGESKSGETVEAEYLAAVCATRLFNGDAEYRMKKFVAGNPDNPLENEAWLELAENFYQAKNYRSATRYYDLVDRLELKEDRLSSYYFKSGYSHFMEGDRKKAMLFFSELMDVDTEYSKPAIYYFSYIAYEEKMYLTAYDGFIRLIDDESFGDIVPFYIVQIKYILEDYDGILEMAPQLIDAAGEERKSELYRLIGDAYFKKGDYQSAARNLEEHLKRAIRTGRDGSYQLAYCYYMNEEYDRAIELFQEVTRRRDELAQHSYYLLGDCYLRKNLKDMARAAFSSAAKMDYDREIKEDALFNFAKLTYETVYSPFGEVIRAFQEYIEQFPASENIEEAYEYLVSAYMKVKNYRAAIQSLDRIAYKDERLERAYQKVAFLRGLELYQNLDLNTAVGMFDKSLQYGKYDYALRARAHYWKGESLYRLNETDRALEQYQAFIGIPGSSNLDENRMVAYNMGYIYYNKGDYPEALRWFKNFESAERDSRSKILTDVYNRIADCYYINTGYGQAISYYDKVIENSAAGSDYALFQKGFALGLMHDQDAKTRVLTRMINEYPNSTLVPNAIFERGRAYTGLNKDVESERDFLDIINSYPSSVFVPRAIVQLGLLYYNRGENERAITRFKEVIEKYRSTPEARNALTGLRNTYVDMNDVEAYFAYVRNLEGYADISSSERDSLLYVSGENLYIQGNCDRASQIFRNYLDEFSQGSFRLNACFYLAECLIESGQTEEALKYYSEVSETPNNPFLEKTYQSLSGIYYLKEIYDSAYYYYNELERVAELPDNELKALVGKLRSAYNMGDAQKTLSSSENLLNSKLLTEELAREASFKAAKSYYALGNYERALNDFRKVAVEVTSSEGAESKYRAAQILYMKGDYDDAETLVYEFIDQNTPHQYWMARMFILLADISLVRGDEFQARATLQSLKDYYQVEDDGILDEVNAKLDEINRESQVSPDSLNINPDPAAATRFMNN